MDQAFSAGVGNVSLASTLFVRPSCYTALQAPLARLCLSSEHIGPVPS